MDSGINGDQLHHSFQNTSRLGILRLKFLQ